VGSSTTPVPVAGCMQFVKHHNWSSVPLTFTSCLCLSAATHATPC
jgi:hypothetical protein